MRKLLVLSLALVAIGCGGTSIDKQITTRAKSGYKQAALEVSEDEFVCPHVVSINNQAFDIKAVISGEVEDQFGPFVPCLTLVRSSDGTCPNCKQAYRVSGDLAEGEEGPPLALPKLKCPHQHDGGDQLIDPVAVLVKGSKDSILAHSNCPSCKRYFTVTETDLLLAVDIPEESLCPSCNQPVSPLMNACTNKKCSLDGVIRNQDSYDGPCWRCGGLGMCPNCKGSGQGNLGIFGDKSPAECWTCGTSGRCPDCDPEAKDLARVEQDLRDEAGMGFSVYEGVVPTKFSMWKGKDALVSGNGKDRKARQWRFDHEGGDSGSSSDDQPVEDAGPVEAPDEGGSEDAGGDGGGD